MENQLTTDRLILRQIVDQDACSLNKIANQDYILKWLPDWKSSVEDTQRLIRHFIMQYPIAKKETARVMFAVCLKETVEIIGMVGIGNKKEVDNEIEIAYFISKKYAGNDYISEAAKAVSQWALSSLHLDYLIAIVEPDNYPSQKVIAKCGFQKLDTRMIMNSGEAEKKPFYYYRVYNNEIKRYDS